jgi:predicted acylesterase/phospholipase RssA
MSSTSSSSLSEPPPFKAALAAIGANVAQVLLSPLESEALFSLFSPEITRTLGRDVVARLNLDAVSMATGVSVVGIKSLIQLCDNNVAKAASLLSKGPEEVALFANSWQAATSPLSFKEDWHLATTSWWKEQIAGPSAQKYDFRDVDERVMSAEAVVGDADLNAAKELLATQSTPARDTVDTLSVLLVACALRCHSNAADTRSRTNVDTYVNVPDLALLLLSYVIAETDGLHAMIFRGNNVDCTQICKVMQFRDTFSSYLIDLRSTPQPAVVDIAKQYFRFRNLGRTGAADTVDVAHESESGLGELLATSRERARQVLSLEPSVATCDFLRENHPALLVADSMTMQSDFETVIFKWPLSFLEFAACRDDFEQTLLSEIALALDLTHEQRQAHLRIEAAFPGSVVCAVGVLAIAIATGVVITSAVAIQWIRRRVALAGPQARLTLIGQAELQLAAAITPQGCRDILRRNYLRVALFDGGGVKGLLTLRLLQTLESRLQRIAGPNARVGHVFDVMIGTSTGGIIAVCLRRGMTVAATMSMYRRLASAIFPKGFLSALAGAWRATGGGWYSTSNLERICINELGGAATLQSLAGVGVITRCLTTRSTHLLFSDSPRTGHLSIVSALRMTSAAPFYFYPVCHNGDVFVDGGVGANCPAEVFFNRFHVPQGSRVISFGCGYHAQQRDVPHGLLSAMLAKDLIDSATDTQQAADRAAVIALNRNVQFLRYNPALDAVLPYPVALDCTDASVLNLLSNTDWYVQPNFTNHTFQDLWVNVL